MVDVVMLVALLAIFTLIYGALVNWRAGDRRRAVLMMIAAVVLAGNVALWIMPVNPPARAESHS